MSAPSEVLAYPNTEIVLGLVAPVGTNLAAVEQDLGDHLRKFDYTLKPIKLSSFLDRLSSRKLGVKLKSAPEFARISSHMDAGNAVREKSKRGDLLALHAAHEIWKGRASGKDGPEPSARTAHLLHSLKNPEEVRVLRQIYGPGFFLIGVYSPEVERLEYLQTHKNLSASEARALVSRDAAEDRVLGQQTRDTFQLADVFIRVGHEGREQLWRFIDLIFGHPYHTPTPDENAMFLAYAASLRSADLSRQVGAVIVSDTGETIATGANDVPRSGGGLYWPGADDQRDFVKGYDSNKQQIQEIVEDTLNRVIGKKHKRKSNTHLLEALKPGRLYDLTEFGRAVHAEMEAITACARAGVSPRSGTLYTTTFPCHNCAKHIIDAGLRRVVYVEPYPKSRAIELHADAIRLEERDGPQPDTAGRPLRRVRFTPFIGISARRYFDLFSTRLGLGEAKKRSSDGRTIEWQPNVARPRVGMPPASYLQREHLAASELQRLVPETGRKRKHGRKKSQR